jgi:hypothetical protein
MLIVPGQCTYRVTDQWARDTSATTWLLTKVKIAEVALQWPAGGQVSLAPAIRRSRARAEVRVGFAALC